MSLISACLIVKNEEKNLRRCLKSIVGIADEIIVSDTGSTDRTKEIALCFGAKVFDHPWENSFSKARNDCHQHATGDYILVIDADEYLDIREHKDILEILKNGKNHSAFTLMCVSDLEGGGKTYMPSLRIFKNGAGFYYAGCVHNQLVMEGLVAVTTGHIYHCGYGVRNEKRIKRYDDTFKLLEKEKVDAPESAFVSYNLARQYTVLHQYEKGRETALEFINKARQKGMDWKTSPYVNIYHTLFVCSHLLGDLETPIRPIIDLMEIFPQYPDALFDLGMLYCFKNDPEKSEKTFKLFIDILKIFKSNPAYRGDCPPDIIGWTSKHARKISGGNGHYVKEGKVETFILPIEIFSLDYESHVYFHLAGMYQRLGDEKKMLDRISYFGYLTRQSLIRDGKVFYKYDEFEIPLDYSLSKIYSGKS